VCSHDWYATRPGTPERHRSPLFRVDRHLPARPDWSWRGLPDRSSSGSEVNGGGEALDRGLRRGGIFFSFQLTEPRQRRQSSEASAGSSITAPPDPVSPLSESERVPLSAALHHSRVRVLAPPISRALRHGERAGNIRLSFSRLSFFTALWLCLCCGESSRGGHARDAQVRRQHTHGYLHLQNYH
jgi:hypothetical protein